MITFTEKELALHLTHSAMALWTTGRVKEEAAIQLAAQFLTKTLHPGEAAKAFKAAAEEMGLETSLWDHREQA